IGHSPPPFPLSGSACPGVFQPQVTQRPYAKAKLPRVRTKSARDVAVVLYAGLFPPTQHSPTIQPRKITFGQAQQRYRDLRCTSGVWGTVDRGQLAAYRVRGVEGSETN